MAEPQFLFTKSKKSCHWKFAKENEKERCERRKTAVEGTKKRQRADLSTVMSPTFNGYVGYLTVECH